MTNRANAIGGRAEVTPNCADQPKKLHAEAKLTRADFQTRQVRRAGAAT